VGGTPWATIKTVSEYHSLAPGGQALRSLPREALWRGLGRGGVLVLVSGSSSASLHLTWRPQRATGAPPLWAGRASFVRRPGADGLLALPGSKNQSNTHDSNHQQRESQRRQFRCTLRGQRRGEA